jgi:hypothetical protein
MKNIVTTLSVQKNTCLSEFAPFFQAFAKLALVNLSSLRADNSG